MAHILILTVTTFLKNANALDIVKKEEEELGVR